MSLIPSVPGRCAGCHLLPNAFYSEGPETISSLEALRGASKSMEAGEIIFREGEPASEIYVLYDGWAIRYRLLSDGQRQILTFMLPGDPLGLPLLHSDRLPFSVQAVTPVSLCAFRREEFSSFVTSRLQLVRQADQICSNATAAAYERLVDIGRRSAYQRIGRLLLELVTRLEAKGLSDGGTAHIPLRQAHLADALGLTTIHVGRVLRQMRADRLLTLARGRLEIHDLKALRTL